MSGFFGGGKGYKHTHKQSSRSLSLSEDQEAYREPSQASGLPHGDLSLVPRAWALTCWVTALPCGLGLASTLSHASSFFQPGLRETSAPGGGWWGSQCGGPLSPQSREGGSEAGSCNLVLPPGGNGQDDGRPHSFTLKALQFHWHPGPNSVLGAVIPKILGEEGSSQPKAEMCNQVYPSPRVLESDIRRC